MQEEAEQLTWKHSYTELTTKIQRTYGVLDATLLSRHNSMAMLLNHALGGASGGKASSDDYKDVTAGASSVEEAVNAINAMFAP